MITNKNLKNLIEIPAEEKAEFDNLIKTYRSKYIQKAGDVVDIVFKQGKYKNAVLKKTGITNIILEVREEAYNVFLEEEAKFNTNLLRDISLKLDTPKSIINYLIEKNITNKKGQELLKAVRHICGEYAGRISPYIYALSLSNTQSRRSRAGTTFEAIIYELYDILKYPYSSQNKIGRKIFEEVGLGKKVDSVLPGIEEFKDRRNKTIIGTMKTTLRERWQEVAEEIERTKIPEIHLLTVDEVISKSKAKEMANHNIVIVTPDFVAENPELSDMKNIISFEEYFFEEIPNILKYWKK